MRIAAIVLLAAGVLSLIYKGFTYTSETHESHLGPIDISVKEKKHVDLPIWVGVILVVSGGALLAYDVRKA